MELAGADVPAEILARAVHLVANAIGGVGGGLQGGAERGDTQHAAAGGDDLPVGAPLGAGVIERDSGRDAGRESDDITLGIGVRVALGGDYDADCGLGAHLEFDLRQRPGRDRRTGCCIRARSGRPASA